MKKKSLLAMSLMGLALVACSEDEQLNGGGTTGNSALNGEGALVSMTLDITSPTTKGSPGHTNTVAGSAIENKINNVTIVIDYGTGTTPTIVSTATDGGASFVEDEPNTIEFNAPEGEATFYVYANLPNSETITSSSTTSAVSGTTTPSSYYNTTGDGNFFMSNIDGIGVTRTINADGENQVDVTIERGAAKVTVESKAELSTDKLGGKLFSMSYGLSNRADKFYLLAQGIPFTTDVPGVAFTGNDDNVSDYISVSLDGTVTIYEEGKANTDKLEGWNHGAAYCLENIHAATPENTKTPTGYTKGNTTFVNFQTEFMPAKVLNYTYNSESQKYELQASGENNEATKTNDLSSATKAATFYVVRVAEEGYSSLNSSYIMASDVADATLSEEADENGFYTLTNVEGVSKVDVYEDGKCWFGPIWINNAENVQASPIYRNDWYHLAVTGIKLPGSPTKPTIPDDEEEDPLEPDVNMTAALTVSGWEGEVRTIELK